MQSDARITGVSKDQEPWVKALKYKYPGMEEAIEGLTQWFEGSTRWDDGPSYWDGGAGEWDDPCDASVWRNVWIYVRARPLECPPAGMCFLVLHDSAVERWTVRSGGLYNSQTHRQCARSEWPAPDQGTSWAILGRRTK